MMQALVGIVILIFLWLGVLAGLLGLLDVARSQYENKTTRWLGLAIGIPTIIPIFALAIAITPLLLEKIATEAFERPTFEFTGLRGFLRRSGGMMGWAATRDSGDTKRTA